jgi:hypothetical protein
MTSTVLKNILKESRENRMLTPILRAALANPDFSGFNVHIPGWNDRAYDGWFHPSEHAIWTTRQLYYYLLDGVNIPGERPSSNFVLAVSQGTFFHLFVQHVLLQNGILVRDEMPLKDAAHNRRGHTDGLLSTGECLEIKTSSHFPMQKISDVQSLRDNAPRYYAQTQDYLDMAGAEVMRYLVIGTSNGYPFTEYAVPADQLFQRRQRAKYRAAIDAYLDDVSPERCCAPHSREATECPVASLCPYGEPLVG